MSAWLAVAGGGAVGSVLRFWLSGVVHYWAGRGFPWGTLVVNIVGCLIIGVLYVLLIERLALGPTWRAALLIGLLGGFTTFSSFTLETLLLVGQGEVAKALLNAAASLGLCLVATWAGLVIGRTL